MKIEIIKTGSWTGNDITEEHRILNEAIEDFVTSDYEIINIQKVEQPTYSNRFYIYIKKKENEK